MARARARLALCCLLACAAIACTQAAGLDDYEVVRGKARDAGAKDAAAGDGGARAMDGAIEAGPGRDAAMTDARPAAGELAPGEACDADAQCSTEHCSDGVCCRTECSGSCEQCDQDDALGTCSPVAANQPCADPLCDGASNTFTGAGSCNGAGECKTPNASSCAPFRCDADGASCATECADDMACDGQPCIAQSCGLVQNGNACMLDAQCTSSHCVDGVCCDASACPMCQTCNGGSPGRCAPVAADTADPHGRCSAELASCMQASCNGAGACTAVAANTSCSAQCTNSAAIGGRIASVTFEGLVCDGVTAFACTMPDAASDCGGAICASSSRCMTSCTSTADCTLGHACDAATGRCKAFDPRGVLQAADLAAADVTARALPNAEIRIDVDRGAITSGATVIRAANGNVTAREVRSGIAYQQRSGQAVFTFGDLSLPEDAVLQLMGTLPVVLASIGTISIDGLIDARPMDLNGTVCVDLTAAPGGSPGGDGANACACPSATYVGKPGLGAGAGQPSVSTSPVAGGGGAGHAAAGGSGGPSAAGAGGALYAGPAVGELIGGSGGAGGGNWSDSGRAPRGGGGGGALQLVAATSIAIGNGGSEGGINAGGCSGSETPSGALSGGGGGGGSGGTIWFSLAQRPCSLPTAAAAAQPRVAAATPR